MIARAPLTAGAAAAVLRGCCHSLAMKTPQQAPTPPTETGREQGLEWARFDPLDSPVGGVLILHGAGSRKENHYDVARLMTAAGLSAICFDQRGHGTSDGPMDERLLEDVVSVAGLFGQLPVGLRGSSMGGFVALGAAHAANATAVVAICPTTAAQFGEGVRAGRMGFDADPKAIASVLDRGEPDPPDVPVLLLHADGDEVVPVSRSRALAPLLTNEASRYVEVPGGHHRSLQHDPEFVALSVKFLAQHIPS